MIILFILSILLLILIHFQFKCPKFFVPFRKKFSSLLKLSNFSDNKETDPMINYLKLQSSIIYITIFFFLISKLYQSKSSWYPSFGNVSSDPRINYATSYPGGRYFHSMVVLPNDT